MKVDRQHRMEDIRDVEDGYEGTFKGGSEEL